MQGQSREHDINTVEVAGVLEVGALLLVVLIYNLSCIIQLLTDRSGQQHCMAQTLSFSTACMYSIELILLFVVMTSSEFW